MNKVGHVRSRRCAIFFVHITILSASSGSTPAYAGSAKNRKPATASLLGDTQTGSLTVSDSANRKQVGQLNKCRLVIGTNLTSSDRYHCISMPQVGQVGASRSSSECFSLSITTLPRSSDESPKPNRQKPLVAGSTSHSPLFTAFCRRLLGITRANLRMFGEVS
jgi:hypothetical protein